MRGTAGFLDDDRRLLGRVTLSTMLPGKIGFVSVLLLDVSLRGAQVTHDERLPIGPTCWLTFQWQDSPIRACCEILRSRLSAFSSGRLQFRTGLKFVDAENGSTAVLRQMIGWHVMRALDEQRADALGVPLPPDVSAQPEENVYIRCELFRGVWRKITTTERAQPVIGFTVRASEPPRNVDRLCTTYLISNRETRQLIQRTAAASLESDLLYPIRSYLP